MADNVVPAAKQALVNHPFTGDDEIQWEPVTSQDSQEDLIPMQASMATLDADKGRNSLDVKESTDTLLGPNKNKKAQDEMLSDDGEDDVEENSPVPAVAAVVAATDDPTLPTLTFRFWVLSTLFTFLSAAVAQFYFFRANTMTLSIFFIQLVTFGLGKGMAGILPKKEFNIFGWRFSMNPGPFNHKEHVLICIAAGTSSYTAYAIDNITVQRLFYNQDLGWFGDIAMLLTTQCIGYGIAGFLRNILVKPAQMVWPSTLVQVALYQALHHKRATATTDKAPKNVRSMKETSWKIPKMRLFTYVLIGATVWQWFPGFVMPVLASIPLLCWFNPASTVLQVLGSGYNGLGLGVISLDWNVVGSFGPMYTPWWAQVNTYFGAMLMLWVITPTFYFLNLWDAQLFPPVSSGLFTTNGTKYDLARVLTPNNMLDVEAYEAYSPLRMSTYFAITYGISFLALSATLSHVAIWYGRDLWKLYRGGTNSFKPDIHTKLMRVYKEVPMWWYAIIFFSCLGLAMFVCEYYAINLPWWAVLTAIMLAVITIIPIGIIQAITNTQIGLNVLTEFVCGYMLPGHPVGNIAFKTYGYMAMSQALALVSDLKMGHYMKISPRTMFLVQIYGTVLGSIVNYLVMNIIMSSRNLLEPDSTHQWDPRATKIFFSASVIWGAVAPGRMFGPMSIYHPLLYCFLIGMVLPVPFYFLHKRYPNSFVRWKMVNVALVAMGASTVPQNPANFIISGLLCGFVFQFVIYRYHYSWWRKYNYITSAAMDAGAAFGSMLIFLVTNLIWNGLTFPSWWGNNPEDSEMCAYGSLSG